MPRFLGLLASVCALLFGLFWVLTRPADLAEDWAQLPPGDVEKGALVFAAAGCQSCHTESAVSAAETGPLLSGGKSFPTAFGTFYASNISSDPVAGIGAWSLQEFARAVTLGVSPDGAHYFPAFPYTAYAKMLPQDVVDLFAYIQSLPASARANAEHALVFPFSWRRAVGIWKRLYLDGSYHLKEVSTQELERGRYLVEALAHCAECHTPRTALGGLDRSNWMAGAPDPAGQGRIPAITPLQLDWSKSDLVAYFSTGLTPDYDSAGGDMAEVIDNLATLPEPDRAAIAAYLLALPEP